MTERTTRRATRGRLRARKDKRDGSDPEGNKKRRDQEERR